MVFSRRLFVLGLTGSLATGGGVTTAIFMSPEQMKRKLRPVGRGRRGAHLASATYDDWAMQKDTMFTLDTGHILKLVDVQRFPEHPGRPGNLRPAAFATTFEVKRGTALTEERIYRLAHPEGGVFDLYLNLGAKEYRRMVAVLN